VFMCIYVCICVCVYIYIYIYIKDETFVTESGGTWIEKLRHIGQM